MIARSEVRRLYIRAILGELGFGGQLETDNASVGRLENQQLFIHRAQGSADALQLPGGGFRFAAAAGYRYSVTASRIAASRIAGTGISARILTRVTDLRKTDLAQGQTKQSQNST